MNRDWITCHGPRAGRASRRPPLRPGMSGALPLALAAVLLLLAAAPAAGGAPPRHPTRASVPLDHRPYIATTPGAGRFALVAAHRAAALVVSSGDYPGVVRVVGDLRSDIHRVTGVAPAEDRHRVPRGADVVLIGTIGHSPLIDGLIHRGRLDVSGIKGKWETSLETVVAHPLPGIARAFVIAGSDQRGTIYGAYDVSERIGVSPWSWWDDVPARHHARLYVLPGRHTQGTPYVKYRGIFINDENPDLGNWVRKHFGRGLAPGHPDGFNHRFYAKVFELMLRLKANYLWPAVWGRALAEDDPQNEPLAKRYGIVLGTSHEAPMMRGIEEWNRHAVPAVRNASGQIVTPGSDPYGGTGEWSFRYNAAALEKYWTAGIQRTLVDEGLEGLVTVGMRGNGDTALSDGSSMQLMRTIISEQERILGSVTHRNPATIPQVWTLYKEVQRYWAEGLRPPPYVTAVFTDDNWGNIRKLPNLHDSPRPGGYGLYYHFDYVGGGRDYKWVDTVSIPNTWDELHQAIAYGVRRMWVVNVGHLKNYEEPISFFLDDAWDPHRYTQRNLQSFERAYAAENFGPAHAGAIARVLRQYQRLQSIRKPELLNRKITVRPHENPATSSRAIHYNDESSPFSLTDYDELDRVTAQWQRLAAQTARIGRQLPAADRAAWFELVGYEVKATANLYALRRAEFTNRLYARQGRAATNRLAGIAQARFREDKALARYYNTALAGGKWSGFQSQPHIDYGDVRRYGPSAGWQQPQINNSAIPDVIFPAVKRIRLPHAAQMGVAIDGSDNWWPAQRGPAVLPAFSPYQTQPTQYIDVFDRGRAPFRYRIRTGAPWLTVSAPQGRVGEQVRVFVHADFARAPAGTHTIPITITGAHGRTVVVRAVVQNPKVAASRLRGFVEADGVVSINAAGYTRAIDSHGVTWTRIPDVGRNGDGMEPFPVTAPSVRPGGGSPRLQYDMTLFGAGPVTVWVYLSPRANVLPGGGLRYAISVDNERPQVVNIQAATGADDTAMNRQWERTTSDNINLTSTRHVIRRPGMHVLTFWMVDPTVAVQKIVVDAGGMEQSYLGPPTSRRAGS